MLRPGLDHPAPGPDGVTVSQSAYLFFPFSTFTPINLEIAFSEAGISAKSRCNCLLCTINTVLFTSALSHVFCLGRVVHCHYVIHLALFIVQTKENDNFA